MPEQNPKEPGIDLAPGETEKSEVEVRIEDAESFVYSNIAGVSVSPWDVRINFAEISPSRKNQTKVGVVLPPEHAAALTLLLMQQLITFERQFGHIRHKGWAQLRDRVAKMQQKEPTEAKAE